MKINRVVVATLLIVLAVTFYEVRLKPQSRPLYERGLALYRQQRYAQSLLELERAYHIEPNSTAILVLRGWNHLKLRQYHDARENFARAARLDPELVEAQLGLAYVTLETGRGDASLAGVGALLKGDPSNPDFRLAAAVALRKSGKNSEAAEIFAQLLGSGRYRDVARRNLVEMYGLDGLDESLPQGLPELQRPAELQMQFKTSGSYFQHRTNAGWAPLYVKGVNLTVAQPGRFPSEPPHRADVYQDWLGRIAQMSPNTVRAYTILPPAFYRALRKHNSDAQRPRLYLIQQVWLPDTEATNLFTSVATEAAKAQIRAAVDAIHGRGDVPPRQGAGGLYTADVAEYTIAFIVGRPMEPSEVLSNNELNSFRDSHDGKFVAVRNGNPTEVWLASMADFAAEFETENYNHQRPVGLANWAALDPLTHRSEASLSEEVAFRRNMGERAASVPEGPINDNDSVSIDETRFISGASFRAGLFSAYSVFPFYPDFMYREPAFSRTRDAEGPNPFFGYLKVLKSHYKDLPILATDYGASSSIGVSRLHPLGWRQGGLTERRQGELLARMTRNIADAQLAGGLVSGWQDEWHRTSWVAAPLAVPAERRPMWNDRLDPDQGFGLWTYDPSRHKQFFASTAGWRSVEPIYRKVLAVRGHRRRDEPPAFFARRGDVSAAAARLQRSGLRRSGPTGGHISIMDV